MHRVRIHVPVFSSPTSAFGNATGDMEIAHLPNPEEAFPWPAAWLAEKPAYFSPEQRQVWSVSDVGGQLSVLLAGIVCHSNEEARDCAAFLENRGGLFFDEYKQGDRAGEA